MLGKNFDDALLMAARVHAGQQRKGTEIPYLSHLLGVAAIALEHGATEPQAIAALLHDAIEDGEGDLTRQEIAKRFGPEVERIVVGCSDSDGGDKAPWIVRKHRYLSHLPKADADVLFVSAADKLHNLRAILTDLNDPAVGPAVFKRFKAGREGTLWYYGSLVAVYKASNKVPVRLLNDLEQALRDLALRAGPQEQVFPEVPPLPADAMEGSLNKDQLQELLVVQGEMFELALYGVRGGNGRYFYSLGSSDGSWELVDEERPDGVAQQRRRVEVSPEAVLEQLDQNPWVQLHPRVLHPAIVEWLAPAYEERVERLRAKGEEHESASVWDSLFAVTGRGERKSGIYHMPWFGRMTEIDVYWDSDAHRWFWGRGSDCGNVMADETWSELKYIGPTTAAYLDEVFGLMNASMMD